MCEFRLITYSIFILYIYFFSKTLIFKLLTQFTQLTPKACIALTCPVLGTGTEELRPTEKC